MKKMFCSISLGMCFSLSGYVYAAPDCNALPGPGVNWNSCNKSELDLAGLSLANASLENTILTDSSLNSTLLTGTDMYGAKLERADLRYIVTDDKTAFECAKLTGALLGSNSSSDLYFLQGAHFDSADFTGATLQNMQIYNVTLKNANFTQAIFVSVYMPNYPGYNGIINFEAAVLTAVDFNGSNFHDAKFTNAQINGANFANVDFSGADFTGASFNRVDLSGAIWTNGRKCPSGTIANAGFDGARACRG